MQSESPDKRSGSKAIIAIVGVVIILPVIVIALLPHYRQQRRAEQARTAAIRVQVAQGLTLSDPVRVPFVMYLAQFHLSPPNNTALGLSFPDELGGEYVKSVRASDGKIIVTYGNQADARISGQQIQLVPHKDADGVTRWNCSSPDIDAEYLPADCRR